MIDTARLPAENGTELWDIPAHWRHDWEYPVTLKSAIRDFAQANSPRSDLSDRLRVRHRPKATLQNVRPFYEYRE